MLSYALTPTNEFQLTHSRGVRHIVLEMPPGPCNFNSRTHVECDYLQDDLRLVRDHFNSRTHVECDARRFMIVSIATLFQLTHSRGVRRQPCFQLCYFGEFQLTHSRGVRPILSAIFLTVCAFQLTHSRGVRHEQKMQN